MTSIPSADTIVDWYKHPYKAERAEAPRRKYNSPTRNLHDSITLTLQFLAAAAPPFDHGRPHLIEAPDKKPTMFWSVHTSRNQHKVKENGSTRTVITVRNYGFDASGLPMVETIFSESFEDTYHNRYTRVLESSLSKADIALLKRKLREFRKSLIVN